MKILYICTHNRCRSILSEAVTNHRAGEHITAHSAGSQPAGAVHPLSLRYLDEAGYPQQRPSAAFAARIARTYVRVPEAQRTLARCGDE